MDIEKITGSVCDICLETGNWIKKEAGRFTSSDVESKGRHNYVTYVDKGAEKMLVERLQELVPESDIIAEEGNYRHRGFDHTWIIDPLDGTTNFIHGIPFYSISVALSYRDELISGVILDIMSDECFYASKDKGAFLNGEPIRVSSSDSLEESLLATGFPYVLAGKFESYLALFKGLVQSSRGIRRLGSAALDLAYVACGRFDGFYEFGLNPWDVAAGAVITREAGGNVTDFQGKDSYLYGNQIIASNGKIHGEIHSIIKRYFD